MLPDMTAELDEETREKLITELDFMNDEELNKKGVMDSLQALRSRGALSGDFYDYSGRNLDNKPHRDRIKDEVNAQVDDRINLEYRDDTGRIMTKRQAFRYECWIFHGQRPGYRKLQKMREK